MVGANPPARFSRTPIGQVVKTSPFHGENTSSNLVWVIDLQWSRIRILAAVDGQCYITATDEAYPTLGSVV